MGALQSVCRQTNLNSGISLLPYKPLKLNFQLIADSFATASEEWWVSRGATSYVYLSGDKRRVAISCRRGL
jgi:hypothetical protein